MSKPRTLTYASLAKIVREFELVSKTEALLRANQAIRTADCDRRWYGVLYDNPASSRPWLVATRVGFLGVSPYADWIGTVFDDAKAAARAVGANDYNGKWNHHSFASTGTFTDRDAVRAALQGALDGFASGLAKIR